MTMVIQLMGTKPRLSREELLPVDDVRNPKVRKPKGKVTLKRCLLIVLFIFVITVVYLMLSGSFTFRPQLVVSQPPDSDSDQQQPPSLQLSRLLGSGNHSGQATGNQRGSAAQAAVSTAHGNQEDDDGGAADTGKPESDLISQHLQQQQQLLQQQAQLLQQLQDRLLQQQQQAEVPQQQDGETPAGQTDDNTAGQGEEESRYLSSAGAVEDQAFPVGNQPSHIENQPSQVATQDSPVQNQPSQAEDQPSQVENQPSQVENQPSQVENQPSQVENQPSQVENQPSQVENQPSRVKNQPSQVGTQGSPIENQPSQVENQPIPVENQPSQGLPQKQAPTAVERRSQDTVHSPQDWHANAQLAPFQQRLARLRAAKIAHSHNHPKVPVRVLPRKPQPERKVGPQAAKDAAAMFAQAGQRAKAIEALNEQRDSGTGREPLQRPPVQGQQYQRPPYQRPPYQRPPYQRQPYQGQSYQKKPDQLDGRPRPWAAYSRGKRSVGPLRGGSYA